MSASDAPLAEIVLHAASGAARSVPRHDEWLTDAERVVLEGLRFEKRRDDWLLGRWTAKQAVIAYAGSLGRLVGPASVEVLAREDGSPRAVLDRRSEVALSLSHSAGIGFAVAGPSAPVGCDVELVQARSRAFVQDYFTLEEAAEVELGDPEARALTANLVWSAKESVLKALREGLRLDTRSVAVECRGLSEALLDSSGDEWRPYTATGPAGACFHGWWRTDQAHVWTVAAERPFSLAEPQSAAVAPRLTA